MGSEDVHEVPFPRCMGHGGIPVQASAESAEIPPPGLWQEFGSFEENDTRWNNFGFTVLDLKGAQITVRHRNDQGTQTRVEQIP